LLAAQPRDAHHCFGDPVTAYINPNSEYPATLRRHDISGRLRLFLRADGSVDHIVFEKRFGYSSLDVAAVDAFRKWKFPPEKKCDIVTIQVTFTLKKMPHLNDLTNRSSQPLAVAMRTFDFTKPFSESATLAIASGSSAPSR
jgi:TonB family protein